MSLTEKVEDWYIPLIGNRLVAAAKKHGQLEAFYEAKEKASEVVIPHF